MEEKNSNPPKSVLQLPETENKKSNGARKIQGARTLGFERCLGLAATDNKGKKTIMLVRQGEFEKFFTDLALSKPNGFSVQVQILDVPLNVIKTLPPVNPK